jgi:hypothetical protein
MKATTNQSVEKYYSRLQFPGGIQYYPLGYLDTFSPLRTVNAIRGGRVKTKGRPAIDYESRREKKEIYRILEVLKAIDIKTQAVAINLPSGKKYYPDFIAQLGDGSVFIVEVKHILDFLWVDVIEKYQALMKFCAAKGYGVLMTDGNWRDFTYLTSGNTIHFNQVVEWFEKVIEANGTFTLKDLRAKYPEEKYWPTLVSYCLLNNYHSKYSFRDKRWAITITNNI